MFVVNYDAINGSSYCDGTIVNKVLSDYHNAWVLQDNANFGACVASELYINVVRLLIATGRINYKLVKFIFVNEKGTHYEIFVDKYGCLSEWPKGFCDISEKLLTELVITQGKMT